MRPGAILGTGRMLAATRLTATKTNYLTSLHMLTSLHIDLIQMEDIFVRPAAVRLLVDLTSPCLVGCLINCSILQKKERRILGSPDIHCIMGRICTDPQVLGDIAPGFWKRPPRLRRTRRTRRTRRWHVSQIRFIVVGRPGRKVSTTARNSISLRKSTCRIVRLSIAYLSMPAAIDLQNATINRSIGIGMLSKRVQAGFRLCN